MNRRTFLKSIVSVFICKWVPGIALAGTSPPPLPSRSTRKGTAIAGQSDFTSDAQGNIFLSPAEYRLLCTLTRRLARLQVSAGHGNFALMDFDSALTHARYDAHIGLFTRAEIDFMEKMFYQDARLYGFMGKKPLRQITDGVQKEAFVRVPGTGNFLFTGRSLKTYRKMSGDVGNELILTSGIRGIPKQFYLFFRKAVRTKGNLSLASRSLAPPGYSFHGISDFDVGSVRLGSDNFTRRFTRTDVFKKLQNLDYVHLRYTERNHLGVRFEPWHIKVT
ncbi:MAG: M15 family metallopeptidase [Thermodesulfobacteriota bacterium]